MDARRPDDILESYRNDYLRLRSALHDRTTGLPSYPALFDSLRTLLDQRRHLGVVHVEVGNIDLVESLYGWQLLDRVLSRVASILGDFVEEEIPRGGRVAINGVGGDRFVLFVPEAPDGGEVSSADLGRIASRVRTRLEDAFDADDLASLSPRLVFRTGQALLSENPFYRFERRVHAAVEEARTLHSRQERRWDLARRAEMRRIIRDAAVTAVFQPVVRLATGEVIGYEALARGPKDTLFEMPRAMFALSSRLGVAADLDRLCRRTAIRESGAMGEVPGAKIFLNVLPGSLGDPEWGDGAVPGFSDAGLLPPSRVVLEVSERGIDADLDRVSERLGRVRERGFGIALDDAGTGYASLATAERLRPDYIKVDVSLVRGIHENLIKQELLASLVAVARRIRAAVVAEGVESESEKEALAETGAEFGQGFLFAGPGPAPSAALRRQEGPGH